MSDMPLKDLIDTWQRRDPDLCIQNPEHILELGQELLKRGEALLAYDVLSEGVEALRNRAVPGTTVGTVLVRLRQQQALALSRAGDTAKARTILQQLLEDGYDDGETMGILGGVLKRIAFAAGSDEEREAAFSQSFQVYRTAFEQARHAQRVDDAYYNGINASALALFLGQQETSRTLADTVLSLCRTVAKQRATEEQEPDYWLTATVAEAELLLGNFGSAAENYRAATKLAGRNFSDLSSTRRQARRILESLGQPRDRLDASFVIPGIAIFTGHMIDRPGRSKPRFPAEQEAAVRKEIAAWFEEHPVGFAFASAACGSDILFLEEARKHGAETAVILPFTPAEFREESVDLVPDSDWPARFERVLTDAARVVVLGQRTPGDNGPLFEFTNLYLFGEARIKAAQLDTDIEALAVWDRIPDAPPGGTASAVHFWQRHGQSFTHIPVPRTDTGPPAQVVSGVPDAVASAHLAEAVSATGDGNCIRHTYLPMLFADVKGYSKLSEHQLVQFAKHFPALVAVITDRHADGLLTKRTAGDGLFLVFRNLTTALTVAVELRDGIAATDWARHDLPPGLSARISLDAGPCFSFQDPVIGRTDFCGDYVNRAARIEPITPPGHIYASETFAALARAADVPDVTFEYAGQIALPKNYGIIPLYHVGKTGSTSSTYGRERPATSGSCA